MGVTRRIDTARYSIQANVLRRTFATHIVGQPEATDALTNVVEKYLSGFYDTTKPIASILFLGPTGTGKTSAVEAFVEGLFGSPRRFIKIDCAEFQHSHDIAKLIGSPPGYLGHKETHPVLSNEKIGQLLAGGNPMQFAVILFDEIEKASDSLWNLLLGILDKGALTLGTNESVDLTRTIIVMTSNVGSKEMAAKAGDNVLGFLTPQEETTTREELKDISLAAARRKFMPEFLNRIDDIVMFNTLTPGDIEKIYHLEVEKLRLRLRTGAKAHIELHVSPAAEKAILLEGYDKKNNARYLKRAIERRLVIPVSRAIATLQVTDMDSVIVDYVSGEYEYHSQFEIR